MGATSLKIMLCGPSGTGKSTLAQKLAEFYNIPYVTTSTKPLWDVYGINKHEDIIKRTIADPLWGLKFQKQAFEYRIRNLAVHKHYVTDRSPIDNVVYTLLQVAPFVTEDETRAYYQMVIEYLRYERPIMFFLPYFSQPIEDDGMRITNRHYQMVVQSVFEMVIKTGKLDKLITQLNTWNLSEKVNICKEKINLFLNNNQLRL